MVFGARRQGAGRPQGLDTLRPPALFSLSPLLGSLPIAVIAADLEGIVLAWNAQAEKMYGWSAEEAIGFPIEPLVIPSDGDVTPEVIMEQLRRGLPWEGEYRIRRRDGRELMLHAIASPLHDESGILTAFVGVAVDVTKERQASIAVLEAVIGNCPTSLTVVGANDRVVLTMGDTRTGRIHMMASDVRGGGAARQVLEFDGRTYDTAAVALPDPVAGPGGVAFVATDITEQLAASRRFQALIENTEDVTSIIDAEGSVLYISPNIERLAGYMPDEIVGVASWGMVHPDDIAATKQTFEAVLQDRSHSVVNHRYRIRHRDGGWIDVEQTIVNRLDDPAIRGLVTVSRDVTERLAGERRLLALNRMHAVLSETGNAMVRAADPMQLLAEVCRILVDTGEFAAAAFTTPPSPASEVVILTACHAPAHQAAAAGMTAAIIDSVRAGRSAATVVAPAYEVVLFSLVPRDGLPGVLALCPAARHASVSGEEEQLLVGLVRDIAFALDSISLDRNRLEAMSISSTRAQQQSIVSRLGFMALGIADTAAVFEAAVTLLAAFGLRQVTLYELLGGETVLVRAVAGEHVGVTRGKVIARSEIPMTDEVLLTGKAVRVDDFRSDPRLAPPTGSPQASIGSGLAVPIRLNGATVAALTVHSRADNDFDAHDVDFYESAANVISGAMERSRYENNIRYDATHDRLTGLPNRILLQDRLAQALSRTGRRQARPLAVLVADLDQFKLVNDSLGHEAADRLLAMVGERLGEAVRPSDTVARAGGDEFVILCEDLVDVTEAATVARRVTERIGDAFLVDGREVSITTSIGIAVSSEEATVEGLLRDADVAMHRAKERGRGTYELFDDALRTRLVQRVEIDQGLHRALERDQFVIAYQPIIDLATGAVREAEALLRWTRDDGTSVPPAEFIPIAEETGMIVPIGAWVLRRACEDAMRWNARLQPSAAVAVAVNLSARQVSHPDLVATVLHALEATGLAPDLLRLEITETALMEEGNVGTDTLQALDCLGVRLSVDDCGTGYSSLMYLRQYPVRVLKVDRYFVAGLGKNPEDDAIVQAVIALAHSLGLSATAEGVETIDQLSRLRILECDAAQGFLWSQTVGIDDFIPLVEAIRASAGDPAGQPLRVVNATSRVPVHNGVPKRPGPRRRSHD